MSNPANCYGNQRQRCGKAEAQQSQAQAYKFTDNWQPGDWEGTRESESLSFKIVLNSWVAVQIGLGK